ncbi:MAG: VWA domain-containing protein [Planctomycetia bacterium]|nr:VWA domain-containing protein [Planctomycetia bacterium]
MRKILCAGIAMGLCLTGCAEGTGVPRREAPAAGKSTPIPSVVAGPAGERASESAAAFNTEAYDHFVDNSYQSASRNPLSTFSVDVDTASYSIVRRYLMAGQLPPAGAVRIEELVNYFTYEDPPPLGDAPFSVNLEIAECPWNPAHRLARIGLKGREFAQEDRPASNLVFLIDVSGSMDAPNKLPLVRDGLKLLVEHLTSRDRVAIVVYAGSSGLALPSTAGNYKDVILAAIDQLRAGGSTHGSAGIQLAYQTATENFIAGGSNRVILCTDGDFNVGVTSQSELVRLIEDKARSGVFLTVLGFGIGNYKDSTLEKLADKGNGNYGYIDTPNEARKLLGEQLQGTLITIAKDVKLQVEFNPVRVAAYRLVGYENRVLATEDFKNDAKDAGEIGAGHSVTALYEIIPAEQSPDKPAPSEIEVDALKYQNPGDITPGKRTAEMFTVALRYKLPDGQVSRRLEFAAVDRGAKIAEASPDFVWSSAVAAFGMVLRDSQHKGQITLPAIAELAQSARGPDLAGYREEFLKLVAAAQRLK